MSRRTLHLIVGITAGMIVGTVHALVTHAGQESSVAARAERPAEPRPHLAVVDVGDGVFIVVPAGAVSGRPAASLPRAAEPVSPP